MGLTPQDWKNADLVQSAVNASGVILSLAEVTPRVWEDLRENAIPGSNQFATHPIVILYMATLNSLVFNQVSDPFMYGRAYQVMREKLNGVANPS